jgi:hypothetical protein
MYKNETNKELARRAVTLLRDIGCRSYDDIEKTIEYWAKCMDEQKIPHYHVNHLCADTMNLFFGFRDTLSDDLKKRCFSLGEVLELISRFGQKCLIQKDYQGWFLKINESSGFIIELDHLYHHAK